MKLALPCALGPVRRMNMKKLSIAAAIALSATAANAGALVDPIVEPEIIIEEAATSSSSGLLIPLLLLIMIGAAVSGGGSSASEVIN